MNRDLALWTGVLAGPVVWMVCFGANWTLVPFACGLGWKPAMYVVTLAGLALVAGSGVLAWHEWRRAGSEYPGQGGDSLARVRYMALGGIGLSAIFFVVLLAQAIPEVLLAPCD